MNERLLRAELARNGYSQKELAFAIGMSETTLYRKIKSGKFGTDEVKKIINVLNITDPLPIFFAD